MRTMVFDVPAENGGALTILKQYYEKAVQDKGNDWLFVISTPKLVETSNVKILRYPWVKKSWLHRYLFDKFIAHRLVDKYNIDEILSLQNVIVSGVDVKQTLYLHQPLPFVEKRYGITENVRFWFYQNIISIIIFNSIKKADKIIVQTTWIKEACIKRLKVDPAKFELKQPEFNIKVKKVYKQENKNNVLFFYPASGLPYKNHMLVIEAVKLLKEKNINNFKVVFTLKGNENDNVKNFYNIVREYKLPIDFIGLISLEKVYEFYSRSILLFPSYIETFGLPLLEAKKHKSPILASNTPFAHEILDDYDKVGFYNYDNSRDLMNKMKSYIE